MNSGCTGTGETAGVVPDLEDDSAPATQKELDDEEAEKDLDDVATLGDDDDEIEGWCARLATRPARYAGGTKH